MKLKQRPGVFPLLTCTHTRNHSDNRSSIYTASFAFFEGLWEAGVAHVFVNLGSDHPSIIEAIVKGQKEKPDQFPRIITCPNEMVALSMADGYARLTGKPQCVIVHVDVGTQGLGAAVHNASCGRAPVLIFAGLSPYTIEGEYRGSRTEYIHWIQDVPDQKQIISQYCRYTGEIKRGRNVKQLVNRALSFAMSEPRGPVYLAGAREAMEEEIDPYQLDQEHWNPIELGGLSKKQIEFVADLPQKLDRLPVQISQLAAGQPELCAPVGARPPGDAFEHETRAQRLGEGGVFPVIAAQMLYAFRRFQ